MDTIHVKTVDPVSQDLLRSAARQGIPLSWERYERLQPQDGFLRLGLSCPYGCPQGPCRIDPFGRGADRGLCGQEKDGMVAAMLLRLVLQGAQEVLAAHPVNGVIGFPPHPGSPPRRGEGKGGGDFLPARVSRALENLGGKDLHTGEIFRAASSLGRPEEAPEILMERTLRLSLLGLTSAARAQGQGDKLTCRAGYGLLAGCGLVVGVTGRLAPELLRKVKKPVSALPGQIVSLGGWVALGKEYLPLACTSGEAELLLSSRRVQLLLAGPGTDPAILQLCHNLDIPCLSLPQEGGEAGEILRLCRRAMEGPFPSSFSPDASLIREARVMRTGGGLKRLLAKGSPLALLGGADTPQLPLGWIPVEVASALRAEGQTVASWGDAALWILKGGLAAEADPHAVQLLDPDRVWAAVLEALPAGGNLGGLVRVCFTGLDSCRDLALALGMAALGAAVLTAAPLPLWGSEKVRLTLADKLSQQGGSLTHFDHAPTAQEVLNWFREKRT